MDGLARAWVPGYWTGVPPSPNVTSTVLAAAAREPDFIEVVGAREHNLDVGRLEVPKRRLCVFTGVSRLGQSHPPLRPPLRRGPAPLRRPPPLLRPPVPRPARPPPRRAPPRPLAHH